MSRLVNSVGHALNASQVQQSANQHGTWSLPTVATAATAIGTAASAAFAGGGVRAALQAGNPMSRMVTAAALSAPTIAAAAVEFRQQQLIHN